MTSTANNPARKQVPLPMKTFEELAKYRESLQREFPPGVTVSLHAAVHHALALASSIRAQPMESANEVR